MTLIPKRWSQLWRQAKPKLLLIEPHNQGNTYTIKIMLNTICSFKQTHLLATSTNFLIKNKTMLPFRFRLLDEQIPLEPFQQFGPWLIGRIGSATNRIPKHWKAPTISNSAKKSYPAEDQNGHRSRLLTFDSQNAIKACIFFQFEPSITKFLD